LPSFIVPYFVAIKVLKKKNLQNKVNQYENLSKDKFKILSNFKKNNSS